MTKFTGDGVFMPMAMMRKSADDYGKGVADDAKEESGSCQLSCGGVSVCHEGWFYYFLMLFVSFCIRVPCNLEFEF